MSRSDVGDGGGFVTGCARIRRSVIVSANGGDECRVVSVHRMPWWMRLVNNWRGGGGVGVGVIYVYSMYIRK